MKGIKINVFNKTAKVLIYFVEVLKKIFRAFSDCLTELHIA